MARIHTAKHGAHFRLRTSIQRGEHFAAGSGQLEQILAAIRLRGGAFDETLPGKIAQSAAEVSAVEPQSPAQLRGSWPFAVRQLVWAPPRGERKPVVEQPRLQDADLVGVETVE